MRYIYIFLIVLITLIILIFMFQNFNSTTISFFSMSITLPLSFILFIIYILGMLTGGSVVGFIKVLIKKSKTKGETK